MSVFFLRKKDKTIRPNWHGEYYSRDGRRKCVNLHVKIMGKIPDSMKASDEGDAAFERSRERAIVALEERQEEALKGRIDKKVALRNYMDRTGATLKETLIATLPKLTRNELCREELTKHDKWKVKTASDFVSWASRENFKTVLDISADDSKKYLKDLYTQDDSGKALTASTIRRVKATLGLVFDKALPEGAPNPFRAKQAIERKEGDRIIHRKPLTEIEVEKLLEAAKSDRMTYDLIVCALSTGLRRGDCCKLRWDGVNLRTNTLRLTTGKTKTDLYLPILPLFKTVLERRLAGKEDDAIYVFPEAEKMLRENDTCITYRVKKIFAKAFGDIPEADTTTPNHVNLKDVLPTVLEAIGKGKMRASKRETMIDFVNRYANGLSYRSIEKDTGKFRSSISILLNEAQRLSGIRFLKSSGWQNGGIKTAIAQITRTPRKHGSLSASRYDFHCLRTTFVTLAISRGFSIDKLRALTGHATVEIVLKHYFKPRGIDFADELIRIMPESLTTAPEPKQIYGTTIKQLTMPESQRWEIDDIATRLSKLSKKDLGELDKFLRTKSA